jgi:RNA polymerase sigma factor (sigma-70 family)
MARVQNGAVLKSFRVLINAGPLAGLSDGQLLARFTEADGEMAEVAFAAIVDRHGPMVRRICGQMLRNLHDAQDAFQACFFILARKARSVRTRDSVASWLHGVAYRVCLRARLANSRRRAHERMAATKSRARASSFDAGETADWAEVLHAELARLPVRFRAPILLCDLEDLTYEEAARFLGCPVGTVKSRLARGRERLRVRLGRRGLAPSARTFMAPVLRASVPSTFRDATAHAAVRFTTHGHLAVGSASTPAAALAQGMLKSMILIRLKIVALVLALTSLGTTTAGVLASIKPGGQPLFAIRETAKRNVSPVPGITAIAAQPVPTRPQPRRFGQGPISKIEFQGNLTITPDKIKPKLLSRVGRQLDQDRLETDLKTLIGTKWFLDVRYRLYESPPRRRNWNLVFVVREVPLLANVEFRGLNAIHVKQIEDMTGLKRGIRADPAGIRRAVSEIQSLYVAKGYDLASVTLLEGGNPGETKVVIEVIEGPKVKVKSITFVGNHYASAAQLQTEIGARKPIPVPAGQHTSNLLDDDRQTVVNYYQSQGFFDVNVTPLTRPGADPGQVDLTFVISEGTRYKARNVIIERNSKITTEKLREGLELHSGKPFTMATREADKSRMFSKYAEIGCVGAQVHCEPRFTNELGVMDLVYKIEEDEPLLIDELRIRGVDGPNPKQ